jgi:hypothetical protein
MLNHTMLTVTLTASDLDVLKVGSISEHATSEKWGVGHPSAARRYQPPHPLSHPSRKTFFAPKMNSRIPHIDRLTGLIPPIKPVDKMERTRIGCTFLKSAQKGLERNRICPQRLGADSFSHLFPQTQSPPHSPSQTFYVPHQGHTQSHPQNAPYTPSRVSNDGL